MLGETSKKVVLGNSGTCWVPERYLMHHSGVREEGSLLGVCNFDTFEITHFLVLTFVSLARTRHFIFFLSFPRFSRKLKCRVLAKETKVRTRK
jgi:hypothetical protein